MKSKVKSQATGKCMPHSGFSQGGGLGVKKQVSAPFSSCRRISPSSSFADVRPEEYGTFVGAAADESANNEDLSLLRPAYDLKAPCTAVGMGYAASDTGTSLQHLLQGGAFGDAVSSRLQGRDEWNIPYGIPVPSWGNCCTGAFDVAYSWVEKVVMDIYDKYVGLINKKATPSRSGRS